MRKIFVALAMCAACANAQETEVSEADSPVVIAPAPVAPASRLFDRNAMDLSQPVTITSERFEFDYKEMVAIFDERVKVAHPQFWLEADQVFVFIEAEPNEVKNILAQGNIVMTNESIRAECDWALYTRAEGTLVMRATEEGGEAKLMRGEDLAKGSQITFWLVEERMAIEGGSTMKIVPETLRPNDARKEEPEEKTAEPDEPAKVAPSLYTDPEATAE